MVFKLAAFVAGVVALHQCAVLPGPSATAAMVAGTCLLLYLRRWGAASFLCGVLWAQALASVSLADRLEPRYEGRDLVVEGRVDGVPVHADRLVRFDFRIERAVAPEHIALPAKVRLSWYDTAEALRAGQRWRLTVRLKQPHGVLNPGGFDYEGWLFANGIGATGYVRGGAGSVRLADGSRFRVGYWRQRLNDALDAALEGGRMGGVVKALTIGVRHDIPKDQWEVLRRTGTAHLVAISGLHIGLVAGFAYFLGARTWARIGHLAWSPPRVGAILAMGAALFYAALADFSIPTQRALIMVGMVMIGVYIQRRLMPLRVLAWAMMAVVLYDPAAVLSVGFWLSYGAVAIIVYAAAARLGRVGYWRGTLRIHWTVCLGLAPMLLLFFQQVSVIAPVANFIAVPAVSLFVVPACLLGAVSILVWPAAGTLILGLADRVLDWVWRVLEWLSDWPFAQVVFPQPPAWAVLVAVLGVVLMLAPRGVPGRWLGAVLLVPAFSLRPEAPPDGGAFLTVLDVGQGLAAVVRTKNHVLVFDTGARFSDAFDMGSAVVDPFLRAQGLDRIDALVVSHGDNDHLGGAAALLQRYPVSHVYGSAPDALEWPAAKRCVAGQRWDWDGVRFAMLSPGDDALSGDNDRSCVLKVTAHFGGVLFTGDIEAPREDWLVRRYGGTLASDVIVVPHHGSRTSSTEPFLRAVRPRFALVPAGYRNRYGFPAREVVQRYRRLGSTVVNTAQAGAIAVAIDGRGPMRVRTYRQSHGRFWNAGARD